MVWRYALSSLLFFCFFCFFFVLFCFCFFTFFHVMNIVIYASKVYIQSGCLLCATLSTCFNRSFFFFFFNFAHLFYMVWTFACGLDIIVRFFSPSHLGTLLNWSFCWRIFKSRGRKFPEFACCCFFFLFFFFFVFFFFCFFLFFNFVVVVLLFFFFFCFLFFFFEGAVVLFCFCFF